MIDNTLYTPNDIVQMIMSSPDDMCHIFIVPKEEIYVYTQNKVNMTEKLEMFNEPEVKYGGWRGEFIWIGALLTKIVPLLPIAPMSSNSLDAEIIRRNLKDLLEGKLTQKQIRDMLGITDTKNEMDKKSKADKLNELLASYDDEDED